MVLITSMTIYIPYCIYSIVITYIGICITDAPHKAVEMRIDFWHHPPPGNEVFKSAITNTLKWDIQVTSVTNKAQKRLLFLSQLKNSYQHITMYHGKLLLGHRWKCWTDVLHHNLISCWLFLLWDQVAAEKIIGDQLSSLKDLFTTRAKRRAGKIAADSTYPGNHHFTLQVCCHVHYFIPVAIQVFNKLMLCLK